jgi:hypothetical protein
LLRRFVRFHEDVRPAGPDHAAETASIGALQQRLHRTLGDLDVDQYATAVAHDLRTPLYVVRAYAELLAEHDALQANEPRELLAELLRGTDRLRNVIDGLLSIARVTITAPDEPTDSEEAVRIALHDLRAEVQRLGARIELGALDPAWTARTHLVQVFANLLGNALKFHRPGAAPSIRVSSRRLAEVTEYVVEDNGIGVPAADRAEIFELFPPQCHDRRTSRHRHRPVDDPLDRRELRRDDPLRGGRQRWGPVRLHDRPPDLGDREHRPTRRHRFHPEARCVSSEDRYPRPTTGGDVMDVRQGDLIEVVSNKVEQPNRQGTVTRVLDTDPLRLEVRWDDGHTSVFMPAAGNARVLDRSS